MAKPLSAGDRRIVASFEEVDSSQPQALYCKALYVEEPGGGSAGFRVLSEASLQVIRAEHLGMCFGVRDAIDLAIAHAETKPLTILGDLVHNAQVLAALQAKGIAIAHDPARVSTGAVMVTAHGASERTLSDTRARGLEVIEATCPLVHVAHRAVKSHVLNGYHPVIIGCRGHVEVRGLTEDLAAFDIVLDESDVMALEEHSRIGVAAQTTQPIDRVRRLVALIRRRFPQSDVRFIDTVCRPTKERQSAAVELARRCDIVIVIGGVNSNNTHELVKTCSQLCRRVHLVQTVSDLRSEWFRATDIVGITAGTSTPDEVIDRVDLHIRNLTVGRMPSASDEASSDS